MKTEQELQEIFSSRASIKAHFNPVIARAMRKSGTDQINNIDGAINEAINEVAQEWGTTREHLRKLRDEFVAREEIHIKELANSPRPGND